MSRRGYAIAAATGGIATAVIAVFFAFLPEVTAIYAPSEVSPLVSEFQRANVQDDLDLVFGSPPNPDVVAAMDAINRLDLFGFIPAYTLFLAAASLMLAGGMRKVWSWVMIASALAGAGADVVETTTQLQLTADWGRTDALLPLIAPAHWAKYGALAANAAAVAVFCLFMAPRRWLLGAAALPALPCTLVVFFGIMDQPRLFSAAFALYWMTLLVASLREALRRKARPA